MTVLPYVYFVYKYISKTENDTEYYIHFTMAFNPSIAILFFILVASSIEAGSKQRRDAGAIVHDGKSTYTQNLISIVGFLLR
jgi:hypothetical protein